MPGFAALQRHAPRQARRQGQRVAVRDGWAGISAGCRHRLLRPTMHRRWTTPRSLAPFRWHPEPELIGIRDAGDLPRGPGAGRGGRPGDASSTGCTTTPWSAQWVCPPATPSSAAIYFGETDGPGPAPQHPVPLQAILDEFASRIAPHTLNSYHPRALSYFTPPPLVASIVGEVLAQWTNQGIDVWHAGPGGAFVEEEVVSWLCDLVGYGRNSFGLLTSGGVMANFIAMTLVRDIHLRRLRGDIRPPRGGALEGVRVYTGDQTHFSIARALDELGFPPETLVGAASRRIIPPARGTGGCRHRRRPRARHPARRDLRRRRIDQHRVGRPHPGPGRAGRPRRASGCTWTPPTVERRACLRAMPAASRVSSWRTASRSTPTSGSSRPTTSAGSS